MRRRTDVAAQRLLLLVVWLIATLAASVAAWGAVATLGHDGPATRTVLSTQEVAQQLAESGSTAQPSPGSHPHQAGDDPGGRGRGGEPTGSTTTGNSGGSDGPTGSTQTSGGPSTHTTPPTASPTSEPPSSPPHSSPPQTRSRSWTVRGGAVGASCINAVITLSYATPNDGWTLHVDENGPESIEVRFDRGEAESELDANCVNGTPVAHINEADGGDDGVESNPAGDGRSDRGDLARRATS